MTFTPGTTTQTISVPITGYTDVKPNKTFQFVLSSPSGATLATSTATLTILNDNAIIVGPPVQGPRPSPPQKTPQQIPVPTKITDHPVLVRMLTAESRANAKGHVTYRISCPNVVIQQCIGTVVFDVRVQPTTPKGSKKKPALKTLRVGSGKFAVHTGKTGTVTITLTKPGLPLLQAVKRLKVKATVSAKDGVGVKGVTAWYVSIDAPPAKKTKAKATTVKLP